MMNNREVKVCMNGGNVAEILTAVMDCLEEAFGSLTMVQGRRTVYVLCICISLTGLSVLLNLLGYYTFISPAEGAAASAFSLVMVIMGYRNTKVIGNIKLRFGTGGKNER